MSVTGWVTAYHLGSNKAIVVVIKGRGQGAGGRVDQEFEVNDTRPSPFTYPLVMILYLRLWAPTMSIR